MTAPALHNGAAMPGTAAAVAEINQAAARSRG